jgi:hypothetical protein
VGERKDLHGSSGFTAQKRMKKKKTTTKKKKEEQEGASFCQRETSCSQTEGTEEVVFFMNACGNRALTSVCVCDS